MALYLGSSEKLKINLDGVVYLLNFLTTSLSINNVALLSSDNYILTDSNGVYLVPSDYTEPIFSGALLSSDNYILTDSNGVYLTIKENE